MPADMRVRLEMRGIDRFTEGARNAMDALLTLAEAGQRAGAQMQLLGDAARVLQQRRRSDRVARRADHRRVTRTIRRDQRLPRQEAYQRRQRLRAVQWEEHHPPGNRPMTSTRMRRLRASLTETPRSTP